MWMWCESIKWSLQTRCQIPISISQTIIFKVAHHIWVKFGFYFQKGLKYKSNRRNFTSTGPLPPQSCSQRKTSCVQQAKTDLSKREKISSHDNYYQGGGGNRKFYCWHVSGCFMCVLGKNSHQFLCLLTLLTSAYHQPSFLDTTGHGFWLKNISSLNKTIQERMLLVLTNSPVSTSLTAPQFLVSTGILNILSFRILHHTKPNF